jgi:hypothetical protein
MSKTFQFFCAFIALSGSVSINSFFGSKSDTQLIQAVKDDNRKLVKKLLKSGVDVNELGEDCKTALDAAVEYGHAKIALDLIKRKARVTCQDNQNYIKDLCKAEAKKKLILIPILLITCAVVGAIFAFPVMQVVMFDGAAISALLYALYVPLAIIGVVGGYGLFGYTISLPFQASSWSSRSKQNWMLPLSK